MMVDTRYCLVRSGPQFGDRPGVYHKGEWVDYRAGESVGEATKRHLANRASAAKLAAQPKPAAPVDKQAAAAKLAAQQADDAAKIAELRKLEAERDELKAQLANRDKPKPRGLAGKLNFTGFKSFGPKPAA